MKRKPSAKPAKRTINVALLRKIQKQILAEPRQFQMNTWFSETDDFHKQVEVKCGTAACIGGWAVTIAKKTKPSEYWKAGWDTLPEAKKLLRITISGVERLFTVSNWPDKFRHAYYDAKTNQGQAQAASDRIEHFIKTNGRS